MPAPIIDVAALVAYDGTDYAGFQVQNGVPTVQGALEEALGAVADVQGRVVGAGRTDAGVHAGGQVVGVRLAWRHEEEALQRAWNAHLPPSIRVRGLRRAPAGFHPRFSALRRTYRYTVWQTGDARVERSPLIDRYALCERRLLNLEAMNAAAALLVGEHNFATFGQPPQGESSVRTVTKAEWHRVAETLPVHWEQPGSRLVFWITANAFLRQMVRCVVGSLLSVGTGIWSVGDFEGALAAAKRSASAPPAPAAGLLLERVEYPPQLELWSAEAVWRPCVG